MKEEGSARFGACMHTCCGRLISYQVFSAPLKRQPCSLYSTQGSQATYEMEASSATKQGAILKQVEYYLSDENLRKDAFFSNLLAKNHGWIAVDPYILSCNKIKALDADVEEILQALRGSSALKVDSASGQIRRQVPFEPGVDKGKGGQNGKDGKGFKGSGKGFRGKSSDGTALHSWAADVDARAAPVYDRTGPCGYFMAGYCQYGNRCQVQHCVDYAEAIRHEWLHPGDAAARRALQAAASKLLGEQDAQNLFPRVFSHKLHCKQAAAQSADDLSDLGFQWSPDSGGTSESTTALQRPGRWSRKPAASRAPVEPRSWPELSQQIRYFLVFDLEGKHEIIEFPVMLIDAVARKEIGRFQRFVRPTMLFDGCPVMDTPAVPFPEVLSEFSAWLSKSIGRGLEDLGSSDATDVAFVTCGDWDCKHIKTQCGICGVPFPAAFRQWINIKRSYADEYGGDFRGMKSMLAKLRLLDRDGNPKHGFHHLGMHDVENIARCLIHLIDSDVMLEVNGWQKA